MSMCIQNLRYFPQTKLDNKINAPFLLNEHGDPQNFFQVFTKNSLIKNMFEEKKFDSRTLFFFENSPLLGVFGLRPGFQANHGNVRKSAIYSCNQAIKNSLNEAIPLMLINEALISR